MSIYMIYHLFYFCKQKKKRKDEIMENKKEFTTDKQVKEYTQDAFIGDGWVSDVDLLKDMSEKQPLVE